MDQPNLVVAKLQELGPYVQLGMDTTRIWATGVQVFVTNDQALVVFREQNTLVSPEDRETLIKNVGSVVLPTNVLVEFYDQMTPLVMQLREKHGQSG